MNEKQRLFARDVYKDFFDRCKLAIDNEFYFEAIMMESAAVEGRIRVMLSILGMPCTKCSQDTANSIGLRKKVSCLHRIVRANPELFEGSKLIVNQRFTEINRFCKQRNNRIHALFQELDEYERRMSENEKVAKLGRKVCKLLFEECKRLRDISHNHPELIENAILTCTDELTEQCQNALNEAKEVLPE